MRFLRHSVLYLPTVAVHICVCQTIFLFGKFGNLGKWIVYYVVKNQKLNLLPPAKQRLCVCLCLSATDLYVNSFENLDTESSFFGMREHLDSIRVKLVHEGHRVKVKVTAAKRHEIPYSSNVKL